MKITALVENQSQCELKPKHGLSLYIETVNHKILFDLGPNDTVFANAEKRGIRLSEVDTVILSHGHIDHGGAMERFLQMNTTANIYAQKMAFEPHYSKSVFGNVDVGIKEELKDHPQVVLLEGDYQIDGELSLFVVPRIEKCRSSANNSLYTKDGRDKFLHEQNLIIYEDKTALVMGCGHAGIVNILEKAKSFHPEICVGGYHLFNPLTKRTVPESLLKEIANELSNYPDILFYTCHCTGKKAFVYLQQRVKNMNYLSCGETIDTTNLPASL